MIYSNKEYSVFGNLGKKADGDNPRSILGFASSDQTCQNNGCQTKPCLSLSFAASTPLRMQHSVATALDGRFAGCASPDGPHATLRRVRGRAASASPAALVVTCLTLTGLALALLGPHVLQLSPPEAGQPPCLLGRAPRPAAAAH